MPNKILILFLFFGISLFAENEKMMNYGVLDNHSFVLPNGWINAQVSNLQTNETVDIFNIRSTEMDGLEEFGTTFGDMNGFEGRIGYGLSKRDSIFFKYSYQNIEYAGSNLKNSRIDFWNRFQLYSNNYSFFKSVSVDFGFRQNSAEDITISNYKLMNSFVKKIDDSYAIGENGEIYQDETHGENGEIYQDETQIYITDSNGNFLLPEFTTKNMSADSYYLKFLFGNRVGKKTVLDFYSAYIFTDISTDIEISPSDLVPSSLKTDLSRSETALNLGFSLISEFKYFVFEFNYDYYKMSRDSNLDYENSSHNIESVMTFPISKQLSFFAGGKIMFQQMNSDVPYLYNEYTQTQFDRKYGFARFGLIYNLGVF
ncbi:hypothetical protein ThvES_00012360 [Thiovulum sp. ES]|nr:hypothetical protein ThvES_00012360 [Thiovulum sp. ES]